MKRNLRVFAVMAALAVVLVAGIAAQQAAADKAVDPVCGMTVVKANAKATFDYKGTTYYFCSAGCKEAFAKEPEKYLKAQQAKATADQTPGAMGHMGTMSHMGQGQMAAQPGRPGQMPHQTMENCPMMAQGGGVMRQGMPMMAGRMGLMRRGLGGPGRPMMAAPALAPLFRLYGDKIEVTVENTKDGAAFKVTSKDAEVVKAIQVHMAEHMAMMKKAKEAAAKAPEAACADCPMMKK